MSYQLFQLYIQKFSNDLNLADVCHSHRGIINSIEEQIILFTNNYIIVEKKFVHSLVHNFIKFMLLLRNVTSQKYSLLYEDTFSPFHNTTQHPRLPKELYTHSSVGYRRRNQKESYNRRCLGLPSFHFLDVFGVNNRMQCLCSLYSGYNCKPDQLLYTILNTIRRLDASKLLEKERAQVCVY